MIDVDWQEVMHISRWYVATHLKRFSRIPGWQDIVSETVLKLIQMDSSKWSKHAKTTIVCNCTRWTAIRLYRKHKKTAILENKIALNEAIEHDFEAGVLASDWMDLIKEARRIVVSDIQLSLGKPPESAIKLQKWRHRHRYALQRIERIESGLLERKITDNLTLDDVGHEFGITRERVRQIEGKFWRDMRVAMVDRYKMPLTQIANLVLVGECYEEETISIKEK